MAGVIATPSDSIGFIRGIELRRRRSRVPWIYSLYHVKKRLRPHPRR
jgi:hypothetical protein